MELCVLAGFKALERCNLLLQALNVVLVLFELCHALGVILAIFLQNLAIALDHRLVERDLFPISIFHMRGHAILRELGEIILILMCQFEEVGWRDFVFGEHLDFVLQLLDFGCSLLSLEFKLFLSSLLLLYSPRLHFVNQYLRVVQRPFTFRCARVRHTHAKRRHNFVAKIITHLKQHLFIDTRRLPRRFECAPKLIPECYKRV
mmetsp:Transcript_32036/g.56243  ORF Transcript_32036/g.56243 Transcript_32036/m.56243 type:complete len:204 (+) Transcript_32036:60-671(+)